MERRLMRAGLTSAAVGVIGAVSALALPQAAAAAPSGATPDQGSTASSAARVRELERRIDERDAIIRDLMQRVEKLERQQSGGTAAAAAPTVPTAPPPPRQAQAAPPTGRAAPGQAASAQAAPPGKAGTTAVAQASPAAPPGASPGAQPPRAGPGQFEVSEEAAQRALERALVQSGAALLPRGKFEFVPSIVYQYQRVSTPGQVAVTTEGQFLVTENVARSTQIQAEALLRAGLPWDMQLEVGVPYSYKDNSLVNRANGVGLSADARSANGVGDPSVTLIKQILGESDRRPGLFANIGFNPNVGPVKQNIPLGKGFNQFNAGFTTVKRQDPLVFTGGFNFIHSGENNGFRPGDQYITSFGLLMAVSPQTSLQFAQQLIFYGKDSFNSRALPGSNRTTGLFTAGVVSVLGRNRVISLSIGIGETEDSPNFVVQLAMPIRLN
jgi:hypothetical protein